mgnify:CR=1 FL=1
MFKNKSLMIVGGTGSFGSEVLSQLVESSVKEIKIFSRDEKKQEDLRLLHNNKKLNFVIGDVRDFDSINHAMRGMDYVFQAAALKQVPACEFYPMQAVKTNIIGSSNVLEAALRNGVQKTVVLSTDKAVYPINTMGMTKAIMEKLAVASSRDPRVIENSSTIAVTRYGNVMCSRGSIIPLFIQQILDGKALTVTNPDMTRFMMTLNNSVELVMFAFENAKPGDLFVQKSPASTVAELAEALKDIFNSSVPIKIIGSRHGEKMHETLCGSEEMAKAEDLGGFYRVPADLRDINYNSRDNVPDTREAKIESYDSANTRRLSRQELIDLLLSLDYVQRMLAS